MNDTNQAEIASIGEEMDENFLFNDSDNSSLNKSVTSLASVASSSDNAVKKPKSKFALSKLWKSNNKKHVQQHQRQSCPCPDCNTILSTTVATTTAVPKIRCSIISDPATHINGVASSWTYGYQIPLKHNTSFCSVDEEDDDLQIDHEETGRSPGNDSKSSPSRSKSRLSLNLAGKDKSISPRSPRKISKFLRSSFSKLLQLTNTENTGAELTSPQTALGSIGSIPRGSSVHSMDTTAGENSPNPDPFNSTDLTVMTPTTLAYLEEAKLSGLPVIPFAYPTCVLVDKFKNGNGGKPDDNSSSPNSNVKITKAVNNYLDSEPKSPPGTLESIVDIAQRQYREEQPHADLELDEDFFCGSSVGSVLSESLAGGNNGFSRPRSRIVQANWEQAAEASLIMDELDPQKWSSCHDYRYLDMQTKNHPTTTTSLIRTAACTTAGRSEPIRIKEKQY